MTERSLPELRARRDELQQQLDFLASLGEAMATPDGRAIQKKLDAELREVSRVLAKSEKLKFRDVPVLPKVATEAQINALRNKTAMYHEETATYIPPGAMPNLVLTSGIIPPADRATILRGLPAIARTMAHDKTPHLLNNGRNEVLYYSGPHIGNEDRNTIVVLMAKAAQHALPPPGRADGVEIMPQEYITISARELVEATGREYNTNNRRTVINSVLRWADVTLTLGQLSNASQNLADASEIFSSRLITLSRISQDRKTNASEILFSVPATAAKFFGYRDFAYTLPHNSELPALASFLLDQFEPHAATWSIRASELWRVSKSKATFHNFSRALYPAFGALIGEGYIIELREIKDAILTGETDPKGNPVVGFEVRLRKSAQPPAYERDEEKRKQRQGKWYRYMPLVRPPRLAAA